MPGPWIYVYWNTISSWWLNQPIWKICSSNWIISPGIGVKIPKRYLKPPPINMFQHKPGKTTGTKNKHWWPDLLSLKGEGNTGECVTFLAGNEGLRNIHPYPPLADRTSFLTFPCWTKHGKVTYVSKNPTKTVHKEVTQNVDSSSFSGLWWVFSNHNSTRFSGNSIVDSHSPTAFDFRSGRGFRCVLVEFWCPLALNQKMAWNMATPSIT